MNSINSYWCSCKIIINNLHHIIFEFIVRKSGFSVNFHIGSHNQKTESIQFQRGLLQTLENAIGPVKTFIPYIINLKTKLQVEPSCERKILTGSGLELLSPDSMLILNHSNK